MRNEVKKQETLFVSLSPDIQGKLDRLTMITALQEASGTDWSQELAAEQTALRKEVAPVIVPFLRSLVVSRILQISINGFPDEVTVAENSGCAEHRREFDFVYGPAYKVANFDDGLIGLVGTYLDGGEPAEDEDDDDEDGVEPTFKIPVALTASQMN
jgi:hypothetical protein